MNRIAKLLTFLSLASSVHAEEVLTDTEPKYISESPLPSGWPTPGPYGVVVEKSFPNYRAALIDARNRNLGFWTLFNHIKRNDIPMTAPVEMGMEAVGPERMRMRTMAFLYESASVGALGKDGRHVDVVDLPAIRALTYAFQGRDTKENVNRARQAIEREQADLGVAISRYRLLGYNGPGIPDAQKTWELQAIIDDNPTGAPDAPVISGN